MKTTTENDNMTNISNNFTLSQWTNNKRKILTFTSNRTHTPHRVSIHLIKFCFLKSDSTIFFLTFSFNLMSSYISFSFYVTQVLILASCSDSFLKEKKIVCIVDYFVSVRGSLTPNIRVYKGDETFEPREQPLCFSTFDININRNVWFIFFRFIDQNCLLSYISFSSVTH